MRKVKQISVYLLCITLLTSLFSGCAPDSGETTAPETEVTTAQAGEETSSKETEVMQETNEVITEEVEVISEIPFSVKYGPAWDFYSEEGEVFLLDDRTELERTFGDRLKESLYQEQCKQYDGAWFEKYVLMYIPLPHSGCDRGEIAKIEIDEKCLVLHLESIHKIWDTLTEEEKASLESKAAEEDGIGLYAHTLNVAWTGMYIAIERKYTSVLESMESCLWKVRIVPGVMTTEGYVKIINQ